LSIGAAVLELWCAQDQYSKVAFFDQMRVTANYFASSNNEEPVQIPARNGA
jgi:hypothetical protein